MEGWQDQLAKHGQQHVLARYEQLDSEGRARLRGQLESIDLAEIQRLWSAAEEQTDWESLSAKAEPPPAVRLAEQRDSEAQRKAIAAGERELRAGKVGMVLVAGGQGTRLGFDPPKGLFPIGPVSNASLFQILIERLRAVAARYGCRIPLYVMTSSATHEETIAFLEEQQRFGLPREDLHIFCQGAMPAVDAETGRLLFEAPDSLFLSPDGHGGMLRALERSGMLADMRERGVETLFYGQIDNPLLQVCDAALLGHHLNHGSEMTTQVVARRDPEERVGNVVSIEGQVRIIEYIHLSPEAANRTNPDGSLALWAGNLAVHVFSVEFLNRAAHDETLLPFNRAHKKVPYLSEAGERVEPESPNAFKFERFIFDLLPSAARALVVEADPAEAFAPVKNAEGSPRDTPSQARAAISSLHAKWLREAGVETAEGIAVEISPLAALDASEVPRLVATRGVPHCIQEPTYFGPGE